MKTVLSVVIPTLNEAATLPDLLDALQGQTHPPDEIIVADAGSKDGTRELAQSRGVRVVQGGMPGVGRNAGAAAAVGDLFLFLDADVAPAPNFIADGLKEFTKHSYGVATCLMEPLTDDLSTRTVTEAANLFLQVIQSFVPHAPGFCIWVRRSIHEAIGGFDESAKMAEDHDYVQRAAKYGKFAVLTRVRIPVSMRRMEKEGLVKLSLKYVWTEMYALAGKPVYSMPFEYQFGAHGLANGARTPQLKIMNIAQLRRQLGKFENPLQRLSATGVSQLERLLAWNDNVEALLEYMRLSLDPSDLDTLDQFLRRRLRVARREAQRPLREIMAAFQTQPDQESITLLDTNWLRSQISKVISGQKDGDNE